MSTQINYEFEARKPMMVTYLQLAKDLVSRFKSFKVTHIPKVANLEADILAQIGSGIDHDQTCLLKSYRVR